jgi:hypothetical protein
VDLCSVWVTVWVTGLAICLAAFAPGRLGRQEEAEDTALSGLGYDFNRAAMGVDQGFADGETKTAAAFFRFILFFDLLPALENSRLLFGWNAATFIGNTEKHAIFYRFAEDVDAAVFRAKFDGIAE